MKLPPLIKQANDVFSGWPDAMLTVALLIGAAIIALVAIFAEPIVKAVILAWIVMP